MDEAQLNSCLAIWWVTLFLDNLRAVQVKNDDDHEQAQKAAGTPPLEAFAAALLGRHMIELRAGATAKDLASALIEPLKVEAVKERQRAVLAVFESSLVDEVFVDDGELEQIVKELSRQFG